MRQRIPKSLQSKNVRLAVKECVICGEAFQMPADLAHRYATCSDECTSVKRRGAPVIRRCEECGEAFTPKQKGAKGKAAQYCSNPCRLAALQRVPRPFKGKGAGTRDKQGHVVLTVWEGRERRTVKRARFIVESLVGRRLTQTEVVHHINMVPDDDRPENLWLCRDQAEHMRLHAFTRRLLETGLLDLTSSSGLTPAVGDEVTDEGAV